MAQSKPYNAGHDSYIDAASDDEVLDYVLQTVRQLREMSRQKGFNTLAEILQLADNVVVGQDDRVTSVGCASTIVQPIS